jgi:hypothetical protein
MNYAIITQSLSSDTAEYVRATQILRYNAILTRRKQVLAREEYKVDITMPSSKWREEEKGINNLKPKKWSLFNYLP